MEWFVSKGSIVREIWGKPDTILFIFAGSAAEFALNKAVDWLFFTGRLPADPLGRLFSTVSYARRIVFSPLEEANSVIDKMADIHHVVEKNRGAVIPAWAYRDVLYMLIDYSIRSYELLKRPLVNAEKVEIYDVFRRVGVRMGIPEIPPTYDMWMTDRQRHLDRDLTLTDHSVKLFMQYRKHLGFFRYRILLAAQGLIVPATVKHLLCLDKSRFAAVAIAAYKQIVKLKLDWYLKLIILPKKYISQVKDLDTG